MDELALLDDAALIERVRDGVDEAFGVLWTRYYASAFNYAKTRVGGRGFDADEVVTDAYTRIWRSLHAGRGPDTNFRAYLYAAIRTVAWDRAIRPEDPLDSVDDVAAPQLSEPSDDDDLVARCFYALNERYRTVLWLSAVEGYKPAEVGKALGVDARHASVLIMRSKESFRKLYSGETNKLGDEVNDIEKPAPLASGGEKAASSALGRHLLGGVAGLTAAQAAVAGVNWASAATIISPPAMPASVIAAVGAAAVGGAAAGSSSGSASGSGSSGGASGAASGSGASGVLMGVVGVAVVGVIAAAAIGISGIIGSGGPSSPPPPAIVQPSQTPTESSPSETPSLSVTPTPSLTPTATPSTARPPSQTTKPAQTAPVKPPATQETPAFTPPPVVPTTTPPDTSTPTPSETQPTPWITDASQCTGSDQWYGPWPDGPFTRCPAT